MGFSDRDRWKETFLAGVCAGVLITTTLVAPVAMLVCKVTREDPPCTPTSSIMTQLEDAEEKIVSSYVKVDATRVGQCDADDYPMVRATRELAEIHALRLQAIKDSSCLHNHSRESQ